jgi:hypothetical protein
MVARIIALMSWGSLVMLPWVLLFNPEINNATPAALVWIAMGTITYLVSEDKKKTT